MGGPFTSNYTPVPVNEHIDDGVEAPQEDAEVSEDEGLYNTSAPLLSNRSRGSGNPSSPRRNGFFRKISRWNPFRRSDTTPVWLTSNTKGRNKRSMFIAGFIVFLFLAVVALTTSTAILAKRPERCPNYYNYRRQSSRVPFSETYYSQNYRLNFPKLYPPLISGPASACQTAWNTLTYVRCHEKIWNRSWDNGKHESLFEPDISIYTGPICQYGCQQDIKQAYQLIMSQCTSEDKFIMEGYVGAFSADPGLEDGPVSTIATLERRLQHTCRQSPIGNRWHYSGKYCPAELYKSWFINDGMNSGNLEGLDLFEATTRISRIEPTHWYLQSKTDECDDAYGVYGSMRIEERRFGPGENETTCSWCTIDWFDRKLQSWAEGKVFDPKNGTEVGLPDYLRRISHAGRRCGADDWNRIYGKAIRRYKNEGLLPPDWEDNGHNGDGTKKPCGKKPETNPTITALIQSATAM